MKKAAIIISLSIITAAFGSCKSSGPAQTAGVAVVVASPGIVKASDHVTDEAKVIDETTRKQLETTLAALKERKHIDFAVVTVRTTGDKSAFDYSLDLARERKKNSLEQNPSGLLLLVAVDDRNWHIQITNNLEKDLTKDVLTNLSTPMTDSFRQKQYGEGILKYVNAIIAKLDQIQP
jgi:uncharacterized membrane protein YgcG